MLILLSRNNLKINKGEIEKRKGFKIIARVTRPVR